MAKIVPLICPKCGANVSRETLKCRYCGASFILANDLLQPAQILDCPECGHELPEDSKICLKCGKILAKDSKEIRKLEQLQSRIINSQDELRASIPKYTRDRMNIKDDEYVFFNATESNDRRFIITSQRIVTYDITSRDKTFKEIRFEDVSNISCNLRSSSSLNPEYFITMVIETLEGKMYFDPVSDVMCQTAHRAFEMSEGRGNNSEMILYKLKLK